MGPEIIHWFRRDLRLSDNAALYHALRMGRNVLPLFIFDTDILSRLEDKDDCRVSFIYNALEQLQKELKALGSSLCVKIGSPADVWKELAQEYPTLKEVYTNHDYEPQAIKRDKHVETLLHERGIAFHTFKDQCIFEKGEVVKDDGKPYTVFTPYKNRWYKALSDFHLKSYPTEKYFVSFLKNESFVIPSFEKVGFVRSLIVPADVDFSEGLLRGYAANRDFPARNGTSKISVHLRFGTISIRNLARIAKTHSETWLNELIWRDFYMMILWHFPHIAKSAFKPDYDRIQWRNNEEEFMHWCAGTTGYPMVDAGMRELNSTHFMHNRVRMIVASFLTKHLLIDWRWGEAYFARQLLDFDLSANNGGWQWAASSGCDAAPYFRIFNPSEQLRRFDPKGEYIRRWLPEFEGLNYPTPIVGHSFARQRALDTYKRYLGTKE